MSAYIVVRTISISDPIRYEEYRKFVAPILPRYGGEYLVRGGVGKTLEGEHEGQRVTVIRFEDEEQLLRFWNSADYAEARKLRLGAGDLRVVYVPGFEGH